MDEHDIVGLEREIDFIIRKSYLNNGPSRGMTANPEPMIIDINNGDNFSLPKKRNKTAGHTINPRFAKKKALKNKKKSLNPGPTDEENPRSQTGDLQNRVHFNMHGPQTMF